MELIIQIFFTVVITFVITAAISKIFNGILCFGFLFYFCWPVELYFATISSLKDILILEDYSSTIEDVKIFVLYLLGLGIVYLIWSNWYAVLWGFGGTIVWGLFSWIGLWIDSKRPII